MAGNEGSADRWRTDGVPTMRPGMQNEVEHLRKVANCQRMPRRMTPSD